MRTTLTIDDDVAAMLQKEVRSSGASFKETVNHFLRLGLTVPRQKARKRFVVTPKPMGLPPGLTYDKVEELLEALDGVTHK